MERIKDAIEKARRQQQQVLQEESELVSSQPVQSEEKVIEPSSQPVESDEIKEKKEGLRKVRYRQTRVVELDQEHLAAHRIFGHTKNNPMTASIDLLRTQVLQKMEENNWRTLAITSPTPASGKSVVSINLAMSIARHTQKTSMLVDFDLRRPSIAKYLGIEHYKKSLIAALKGKAKLSEMMINPGIRHFVVLPMAKPVANPAEALASNKVSGLIKDLRDRYDSRIVIFDLAPLVGIDDAISVLPQIDCVLMVVGNGCSTRREIEESMRLLQPMNLLGVVLNKSDEAPQGYYY